MRRLASVLVAVALVAPVGVASAAGRASCAGPSGGGDWPIMNHDLNATRVQDEEKAMGPLQAASLAPAWTFDANAASGDSNNEITAYPIEADGCVFVATSTGFQTPGWAFAINADTGDLVWKTHLDFGVYSTLAVYRGKVYAYLSHAGQPTVVAMDERTGEILWSQVSIKEKGADAVSSVIPYDGMVWVGIAGTPAEGNSSDRLGYHGGFAILDADTGAPIKLTYTIPPGAWKKKFAGGSIWSTLSVDTETGYGYVGTGNPFNYHHEYKKTNSIIKIDMDRHRSTFGHIVGWYHGNVDQYYPQDVTSCNNQTALAGLGCGNLDLDFGATPNIFKVGNRTLVGEGQKSGVYHVVDANTMKRVWSLQIGVPSLVGGIVGTAAVDHGAIFGPHTIAGYLWSADAKSGSLRWVSPVGDAVHWAEPVTIANGIIYTVDLKGFLDAYDTTTGAPLLQLPMSVGSGTGTNPTFSWGGTTVARHTVYATIGIGVTSAASEPFTETSMPDGFVIAFRPQL